VGDARLEGRARVEDAAHDQRRDDDRVLDDDAEAVGTAVARHALRHEVVLRLRMEEQHGPHRLRRLEQRQVLRLVPVLTVHDRVELGALEAEDGHRALELVDRRLDVLHGQRREPREAAGPLAGHPAISSFTSRASARPAAASR
jgi:hypothetical protein